MRRYRVPSELLWVNNGYKECWASSPEAALAEFHGRGWTGGYSNLQVKARNVGAWYAPFANLRDYGPL